MNLPGRRARMQCVSLAAATGLLATGLLLTGCYSMGGNTTDTQPPPASPREHTLLRGIPLPVGFRMVPERSVATESGRFRVAQCEFEGSTDPERVSRFYVDYMPSAHFTLKKKRFDNGEYALRFESNDEECNVRVREARGRTVLVLDVGPLPRGSAERQPSSPPTAQQP